MEGIIPGEKGIIVCLSSFTKDAYVVSQGAPDLTLMDGSQFVELFLDVYDRLSAKWQARYPLEKVYVPRSLIG